MTKYLIKTGVGKGDGKNGKQWAGERGGYLKDALIC
jgi:hypothetical protein